LNTLNSFGILRNQKPLPVSVLARKMIDEVNHHTDGINTYQPKDISKRKII